MLIEYQGEQHFDKDHQISKKRNAYILQQKHDKMKRHYASKNHFKLLEIPYTVKSQDKINSYLNNYFKAKDLLND